MSDTLELRRLLSAAPVPADDAYQLGADHQLAVDVSPAPALPAFDLSEPPPHALPGEFTVPDFMLTLENGQQRTEPDWFQAAHTPGTFSEISIRNPGSRWRVTNWLELGAYGKATVSIADGGVLSLGNFLELGEQGVGTITVREGGLLDTSNWTGIAAAESSTRLDGGIGSVVVTGPNSRWNSANHITVAANGGSASLDIADLGVVSGGNWLDVGSGKASRGSVNVSGGGRLALVDHTGIGSNAGTGSADIRGAGSRWTAGGFMVIGDTSGRGAMTIADGAAVQGANWATVGDNKGIGAVNVSGVGSRWTLANHLSVGDNGGRGVLNVSDGGVVSAANWVEIGRGDAADGRIIVGSGGTFSFREYLSIGSGIARTNQGTLYVAAGGRVINSGGQGFGRGPEVINAPAGRILGSGSIQGQVNNFGFLSPGGSVGLLTIVGNLLQPLAGTDPFRIPATGVTQFDIGGTQRGTQYDSFDVTGRADFSGGKAILNFVDGFAPVAGQQFELVDAATLGATPQSVEVRGLAPGFRYSLTHEVGGRLVLTATSDGVAAPATVQRRGVLSNDADADGDPLTALLVERPKHGTLNLHRDGSFTYAPGGSFTGTDRFTYRADDGLFTSAPATVTIRNVAPVARSDAYATDEGATLTVLAAAGVLKNDTDSVSSSLTAAVLGAPGHGWLELSPDGSFTYRPAANFTGTDSFSYRASDGLAQSDATTVTITVRPVNDNPVAGADQRSVWQGGELVLDAADLLANDIDPDGDTLSVTGVASTPDTHGTVSFAHGTISYRPAAGYVGPASFTYGVSDGKGGTATGTVNVTVLPKVTVTPGTALGAGTLSKARQIFHFAVTARADGSNVKIRGGVFFRDLSRRLTLRSTEIDRFEIASDGKSVTIAGAANVNGRNGYRFEITAEDRSNSGRNDRFRIRVTGPNLFAYDSKGGGKDDRLDHGNVVILQSRRGSRGE